MKQENKIKGNVGEILAKNYLKSHKYRILECNYSNHCGEIDIIAEKKKQIVFIEVKARSSCEFGRPCEAVTPYKQNKIRRAALVYLQERKNSERDIRFDVIEVLDGEINHIEGCF